MNRLLNPLSILLVLAFLGCKDGPGLTSNEQRDLPKRVDFNFHIKPIFSDRCFTCHGPDENARKADFRLDIEEFAFALLDSASDRYAIVPGAVRKSHLLKRIASEDPDFMMPPPESNLALSPYEIALIERWIEQGAEWKPHWSFIPAEMPVLPQVNNNDWVNNEIDLFVLSTLENASLRPAAEESREKLLRRLSFDLTGLPPTISQLDDFLSDNSPDAYEKQVDRLLASPAYGERMASIWLEAARYADSHGYQDDRPRSIWPWRDWVIRAFNENLSYDDFITWQLAGDLLPNPTYDQKLATAFNRNHAITQEGGVINEEYITEYVADRTNTVSTAFMGLTMQCARCHDHKYDPISQKEYYQMFAFFNGIDERGQINYFDQAPSPNMRIEDAELEATITFLDSLRDAKEVELQQLAEGIDEGFKSWLDNEYDHETIARQIEVGLIAHFKLDVLDNLATPNEIIDAPLGRANVKIISELAEPGLIAGLDGNALKFDGKNYLSLGDIGDFEESNRFSFGGYIKPSRYPEKMAGLLVRRNGEQRRGGYELALDSRGRLVGSLVHDHQQQQIVVRTRGSIPLSNWTHILMTYDGSGKASGVGLFINGKRQPVAVLFDQLNRKSILNGNDFLVGNWTPRRAQSKQYEGFEAGAIDEVRIYARELSDPEVKLLADSKNPFTNKELRQFYLMNIDSGYQTSRNKLDSIRSIYLEVPNIMIMQEMDTPRATYILDRGVYDAPTEEVKPGTPQGILPFPDSYPRNRLGLANWLTDPKNSLTARVAVNRFWQMMFGNGLVNTPEDFGNQGDLPSHPRLLDWLAVTFLENDWDVKATIKLIALSATYQQSSEITKEKYQLDPNNVLLSRGPYKRLNAEMLRDQALAASGLLNTKVGGKWVKPYQPPGIWKELANQIGENKYRPGKGADLYRRSLYSYWKRTIPPPVMLTFDASERAVCVLKRQSTSTPLQALVLLNDPQFLEASSVLAQSVIISYRDEEAAWIPAIFRSLTSRNPNPEEIGKLQLLYEAEKHYYQEQPQAAVQLLSVGNFQRNYHLSVTELAALTIVTSTILNLDEAKMES
ncbi:MAG: hypothetical protein DHS20C17_28090 [Cyclobacteriaceae bacterium]|nr:MAG: hypothetical protein DHS20C17_28090 [Cyclobacteriaceae bacterium]